MHISPLLCLIKILKIAILIVKRLTDRYKNVTLKFQFRKTHFNMPPRAACFVIRNPFFYFFKNKIKLKCHFPLVFRERRRACCRAAGKKTTFKSLQINMKIRTRFYFRRRLWFGLLISQPSGGPGEGGEGGRFSGERRRGCQRILAPAF